MAKKKDRDRPYGFGLDRPRIGWYVFPEKENEIVQYGGLYLRWSKNPYSYSRDPFMMEMSIDGKTWSKGNSWWRLYQYCFKPTQSWGAEYDKHVGHLYAPIIEARDKFIAEREAAFKALPPEEREAIKRQRSETARSKREEAKGEDAMKAINCLMTIGPDFVKLKDKIDEAISLMSKGGINKPMPYHERNRGHLLDAINLLGDYIAHMKKCQESSKKKKE